MSDSSYSSKHAQKTRYETSRLSSMLLAEAAKLEAQAWSLQQQEQAAIRENLERTALHWTEHFDRLAVQSENHRCASLSLSLSLSLSVF